MSTGSTTSATSVTSSTVIGRSTRRTSCGRRRRIVTNPRIAPIPRRRQFIRLLALVATAVVNANTASAQEAFAGTWKVERSEPAPWAKTPDMLDAKEIKRLVGASVEFRSNAITGPAPLACKGPHYAIRQYDADMLFQGGLAEYGDPSTTPDKMADKIGFAKRPVETLET